MGLEENLDRLKLNLSSFKKYINRSELKVKQDETKYQIIYSGIVILHITCHY